MPFDVFCCRESPRAEFSVLRGSVLDRKFYLSIGDVAPLKQRWLFHPANCSVDCLPELQCSATSYSCSRLSLRLHLSSLALSALGNRRSASSHLSSDPINQRPISLRHYGKSRHSASKVLRLPSSVLVFRRRRRGLRPVTSAVHTRPSHPSAGAPSNRSSIHWFCASMKLSSQTCWPVIPNCISPEPSTPPRSPTKTVQLLLLNVLCKRGWERATQPLPEMIPLDWFLGLFCLEVKNSWETFATGFRFSGSSYEVFLL